MLTSIHQDKSISESNKSLQDTVTYYAKYVADTTSCLWNILNDTVRFYGEENRKGIASIQSTVDIIKKRSPNISDRQALDSVLNIVRNANILLYLGEIIVRRDSAVHKLHRFTPNSPCGANDIEIEFAYHIGTSSEYIAHYYFEYTGLAMSIESLVSIERGKGNSVIVKTPRLEPAQILVIDFEFLKENPGDTTIARIISP